MTIETYLAAISYGAFAILVTAVVLAAMTVALNYIYRTAESIMRGKEVKLKTIKTRLFALDMTKKKVEKATYPPTSTVPGKALKGGAR